MRQRPNHADSHEWGDGVGMPHWWSHLYSLLCPRDLRLDPLSACAQTAIDLVCRNVTRRSEFGDSTFFEGEVEPCIDGRVVALGAQFGERSDMLVDRVLSERLADGGWKCAAELGSVRSSFHITICVRTQDGPGRLYVLGVNGSAMRSGDSRFCFRIAPQS